ncbi:MAG: ATP-binding protein [Alphaproteobacteria bacterium]|nr:ATP-binding protein [Alphaproteobacteria bacterium]
MARLSAFSFRPFKRLKTILPETLLARSLTILIAPVLLVQLVTGIVFWDRHWSKTTETLAEGIAGNISSLVEIADLEEDRPNFFKELQHFAQTNHSISVKRSPLQNGFSKNILGKSEWIDELTDSFLEKALSQKMKHPYRFRAFERDIIVQVAGEQHLYTFNVNKKYLIPKTTSLLIWWEVGAPLVFILIAVLFMRNQVRPLQSLANAVEEFGKGRDVSHYKPVGALEVRRVGRAFNQMRERVQKQITQRTEMLAGISHDLKTPLTRMQLELALLKDCEEKKALLEDVQEMKKMVEEYLNFAKGEGAEREKKVQIDDFLRELFTKFPQDKLSLPSFESLENTSVTWRPYAMKRALTNIISNALRYGGHVWFQGSVTPKTITLVFEDNGPGIPEDRRGDVFRPFVRLDESRNIETGGYGLGLSICQDIITAHGGSIFLDDSHSHGGLKVTVHLPI